MYINLGGDQIADLVMPVAWATSVAVDDEGFIYVADVGNQWIQKFAPD